MMADLYFNMFHTKLLQIFNMYKNHIYKCIDTHIFSFRIFFTLTSGHQSMILIVKDPDALTRVLIKRTPLVSYSSTKKSFRFFPKILMKRGPED